MQTTLALVQDPKRPTLEEIITWCERRCQATGERITTREIQNQFHAEMYSALMFQVRKALKERGWNGKRGPGGGYGHPDWLREKATKATKAIVQATPATPQELAVVDVPEVPDFDPIDQASLCKDMYFNHVKGLFDDIRSSLSDERLSEFHPEIEEFLNHTKKHLIGVINKL